MPRNKRNIGSMLNDSEFFEFQDSLAIIRSIRVFRVLGSFQYLMFWVLQTAKNLHFTNSDIFFPESYEPLHASQELSRSYCLNSLLLLQSEFKRPLFEQNSKDKIDFSKLVYLKVSDSHCLSRICYLWNVSTKLLSKLTKNLVGFIIAIKIFIVSTKICCKNKENVGKRNIGIWTMTARIDYKYFHVQSDKISWVK